MVPLQWREAPPTGTRLAPSSEGDRGFKDPLPGGGARPGVSPLIFFFPKKPLSLLLAKKTLKCIQLLAVDHSARASMKNAASCEN